MTMKRVLNFGILLLILGFVFGGCGKDPQIEQRTGMGEKGNFRLKLDKMGSFDEITRTMRAVDVQDFIVRIVGTTLKETSYDSTWLRFGDMGEIISLPAGSYVIEAFNGIQKSGFETPYYYGRKEFTVGIQELTQTQVVCQLACVKVTVDFTPLFKDNVGDAVCLVSSADGVTLEFCEEEMGDGYMAVPSDGKLAVTVRGTYLEDNSSLERTYFIDDIAAKQWHKIALNVSTAGGIVGDGMILVDHQVDEKPTEILVPGLGDIIDNNGDTGSWDDDIPVTPGPGEEKGVPTITGSNFNGVPFDVTKVLELTDNQGVTLDVTLTAENGGMEHLYLSMSSTNAELNGIFAVLAPEEEPWDLCNIDSMNEDSQTIVTEFKIVDPENPIRGKEHFVFSIGGFMSFLAGNGDHSFKITVVDANGGTTQQTLVIHTKE